VVAGADQRAGLGQAAGDALQFGQGVDLPGQVVEAHRAAPGGRRPGAGADLEQAEVVVVGRADGLQERGPGEAHHAAEPEHVVVEGDAALDVPDVQHGVVEPDDRHGSLLKVVEPSSIWSYPSGNPLSVQ
jgi:hypothetical protein